MKYRELKLPQSPQSHVMNIKENNLEELKSKKESINLSKHEIINSPLDIYYVNLGKIRL
jgi:hypothetical protein